MEKKSSDNIVDVSPDRKSYDGPGLTASPLVFGILSILCFAVYFYAANNPAPYYLLDSILIGPIFGIIGIIISIITRKSRSIYPDLWTGGLLSCVVGLLLCGWIFVVLFLAFGLR